MPDDHIRPRPSATVLICTRGRGELLAQCLAAVQHALGDDDELLVIEAESSDAERLIDALDDPRCRWLSAPKPGKSRQLNRGIERARGALVLITDDDCVVPPEWIDAMAAPFAEPDVGIAFGPVVGLTQLSGPDPPPLPIGPTPAHAWAFSHGASMAVRRRAALDSGGFDERIGPGTAIHGEEADLLLRTEAAGWRSWLAGGPPVRHLEWRNEEQEQQNLLVYERGGGAWLGAALRRRQLSAAGAIVTRLRYQAGHFSSGASKRFALQSAAAFAGGVAAGLKLTPRRFLEPSCDQPPRADFGPRLPWPAITGRRCLALVPAGSTIPAELRSRGAREVIEVRKPDQRFDVVVTERLADRTDDPIAALRELAPVCDDALLSIERVNPLLSLISRGRPQTRRRHGKRVFNGAAHRAALETAGFEPTVASRPWRDQDATQRALLARPRAQRPSSARS